MLLGKAGKMQSRAEKETAPGETTSPTAPAVLLSNTTDVKSPTGLDTVDGCSVGEIPKVSPDAAVKEEPAAQKDLVEAPRLVLSMKGKVRKNSLKGKPKPDPDTVTVRMGTIFASRDLCPSSGETSVSTTAEIHFF